MSAAPCTRRTAPASAASDRIQDAAVSAMQQAQARRHHGHRRLRPQRPGRAAVHAHSPTRSKIEDVIRKIDMFDVDPGGTAMNEGMRWPWTRSKRTPAAAQLSQVRGPDRRRNLRRAGLPRTGRAGAQQEDPPHAHGRRPRLEGQPHQGPGQDRRRQVVLHRRQPGRGGRAHLSSRSSRTWPRPAS